MTQVKSSAELSTLQRPYLALFLGGVATSFIAMNALHLGSSGLPSLLNGSSTSALSQLTNQVQSLAHIQQAMLTKLDNFHAVPHLTAQESVKTRFYPEDFADYFNVRSIHRTEVDPAISHLVKDHSIDNDVDYEFHNKGWVDLYGPFIDRGFENDRRFYVEFTGPQRGYGMFADVEIMAGQVIGEYVGILTNSSASTDYQWVYPSVLKDGNGNNVHLAVDSRAVGNMLRFANHEDDPNCDVRIVPYKNAWHVLYVANRHIPRGGEVFVSYGPNYWKSRNKVTVNA